MAVCPAPSVLGRRTRLRQTENICDADTYKPHRDWDPQCHRSSRWSICAERMMTPSPPNSIVDKQVLLHDSSFAWGMRLENVRRKKTHTNRERVRRSRQSTDEHIWDLQAPTSNKPLFVLSLGVVSLPGKGLFLRSDRVMKSRAYCSCCCQPKVTDMFCNFLTAGFFLEQDKPSWESTWEFTQFVIKTEKKPAVHNYRPLFSFAFWKWKLKWRWGCHFLQVKWEKISLYMGNEVEKCLSDVKNMPWAS